MGVAGVVAGALHVVDAGAGRRSDALGGAGQKSLEVADARGREVGDVALDRTPAAVDLVARQDDGCRGGGRVPAQVGEQLEDVPAGRVAAGVGRAVAGAGADHDVVHPVGQQHCGAVRVLRVDLAAARAVRSDAAGVGPGRRGHGVDEPQDVEEGRRARGGHCALAPKPGERDGHRGLVHRGREGGRRERLRRRARREGHGPGHTAARQRDGRVLPERRGRRWRRRGRERHGDVDTSANPRDDRRLGVTRHGGRDHVAGGRRDSGDSRGR